MSFRPFTLLEPTGNLAPLVVDSPHSGRIYPADFNYTCPLPLLRQTEDSFVDELVVEAAEAGASVIAAEFPRCYIDVNRAENDIDPAVLAESWPLPLEPSDRTLLGLGLVRRLCKSGVPVYQAPLPAAEIQKRIDQCYRPYHAALQKEIERRLQGYGVCYLIDCHSMPSRSERGDRQHLDFVLGDRQGTSCNPAFTRRVRDLLQDMGFSVALNDPFKGVEIARRYGHPQKGSHALQLEINRRLYMNEATLEKTDCFFKLQKSLADFFQALVSELMGLLEDRLAAE